MSRNKQKKAITTPPPPGIFPPGGLSFLECYRQYNRAEFQPRTTSGGPFILGLSYMPNLNAGKKPAAKQTQREDKKRAFLQYKKHLREARPLYRAEHRQRPRRYEGANFWHFLAIGHTSARTPQQLAPGNGREQEQRRGHLSRHKYHSAGTDGRNIQTPGAIFEDSRPKPKGPGRPRRVRNRYGEPFRPRFISSAPANGPRRWPAGDGLQNWQARPYFEHSATSPENWEFIPETNSNIFKILLHQNGEAKAYIYQQKPKRRECIKTGRQSSILDHRPPARKKGQKIEQNGLTRHAKKCIRIVSECYNKEVTDPKNTNVYDSLCRFITLTFRRLIPSDEDAKKLLNTFFQRLRRIKAQQEGGTKKTANIHYIWVSERQKGQKLRIETINDETGQTEIKYIKSYRAEQKQNVLHFHILTPERLEDKGSSGHEAADKTPERIKLNRMWNEINMDFFYKKGLITKEEKKIWIEEINANEAHNLALCNWWLSCAAGNPYKKPQAPAKTKFLLLPNLSYANHAGAYMAKYLSKENAQILGNLWNMSQLSRQFLTPIQTEIKADYLSNTEILNYIKQELTKDEEKRPGIKKHYVFTVEATTPKAKTKAQKAAAPDEMQTKSGQKIHFLPAKLCRKSGRPLPQIGLNPEKGKKKNRRKRKAPPEKITKRAPYSRPMIEKKAEQPQPGAAGLRYGRPDETPPEEIADASAIARGIWTRRGARVMALFYQFIETKERQQQEKKAAKMNNFVLNSYICEY